MSQDAGYEQAVSLREWVSLQLQREREALEALDKLIAAQFKAQEQALALASEALTIRLDHSNGLIAAAQQKENEFASRTEVASMHAEVERRLASLEQSRATAQGEREGWAPLTSIAMLVVGALVTGVIGLLFVRLAARSPQTPARIPRGG